METDLGVFEFAYNVLLLSVIVGHFFFAYMQWFRWPDLCARITELQGQEIEKTAFLGKSFASYNLSIGVGLLLCMLVFDVTAVQCVVLALIAITAAVGSYGTKGKTILLFRFIPAAGALVLLLAGSLL